jgi:hypothetical protein
MHASRGSGAAASKPIARVWLRAALAVPVPTPAHVSVVGAGMCRTEIHADRKPEHHPSACAVCDDPLSHVEFALRHEPTDLTAISTALSRSRSKDVEPWVSRGSSTFRTAARATSRGAAAGRGPDDGAGACRRDGVQLAVHSVDQLLEGTGHGHGGPLFESRGV